MTLDGRLNVKLEQQIALWLQKQEELRQMENKNEFRPIFMEVNHE